MNKINTLVLGSGGDIGQSIGKILRQIELVGQLIGVDIHDRTPSKFIYPEFKKGPRCEEEGYFEWIVNIIDEHRIDLVIPVSEAEIRFWHKNRDLAEVIEVKWILVNEKTLDVGLDKSKTADFLKDRGYPFPGTDLVTQKYKPAYYPVVVKPRFGSGSKRVHVVRNLREFEFVSSGAYDLLAQEYLEDSQEEYTCGLFRGGQGTRRCISFRRELHGGYSGYGEVRRHDDIDLLLLSLAEDLDLDGSINVQLRRTNTGPKIFEINPRLSSTVLFRHMFGFKDLLWSIENAFGLKLSEYEAAKEKSRFYKGFEEYID